MTIDVSTPDGSSFTFPDGTPQETIQSALDSHFGVKPSAPAAAGIGDVGRAAARGVPIVGGVLDKLNAATYAALAPLFPSDMSVSQAGTIGERYSKNLEAEQTRDKKFDAEHPVISTVAKVAGGTGALLPAAATATGAKLLGLGGPILSQVARSAASGAALSGADAAVRGEPVEEALQTGLGFGAGGAVAGNLIGRGVRAVRDRMAPAASLTPQTVARVGDVEVPLTESQVNRSLDAAMAEQAALRGGSGEQAQKIAQSAADLQGQRLEQARSGISQSLDTVSPAASRRVATAPQEAGERVLAELSTAEQARAAQEAARVGAAQGEVMAVRARLSGQPQPQILADSPVAAGEAIGAGVRSKAAQAKAGASSLYDEARAFPNTEFEPGSFQGVGTTMRERLSARASPILIDDVTTPYAAKALKDVDTNVGLGTFQNRAEPPGGIPAATPRAVPALKSEAQDAFDKMVAMGVNPAKARESVAKMAGAEAVSAHPPPPVVAVEALDAAGKPDLNAVDAARKRLVSLYTDAKGSGNRADARAVQAVLHEFDDYVIGLRDTGKYKGDPAALDKLLEARAAHAEYRKTFTSQGPGDDVGKAIEKIVGRYEGQAAPPSQVVELSYGSLAEPGGTMPVKIAQRMKTVFGEGSPEWGAYKQGLFAQITDTAPGTAERTASQVADRIDKFLNGTKGKALSQVVFSPAERTALRDLATQVRASEPVPLNALNTVDRVMARISGRDGGLPASPTEVVDYLYGRAGAGDKGISVKLAQRLKGDLSPDGFVQVRQGMWSKLTESTEGRLDWGPQKISERLHEFLNGNGKALSHVLYSPEERRLMGDIAKVYKQLIPPPGSVNTSNTAPVLKRIMAGNMSTLFGLLGMSHGGIPGAIAGVSLDKGMKALTNRRNASEAQRLFYGAQPQTRSVAPNYGSLGFASGQGVGERR